MSGKGSGRRPLEVSEESFADNWSRIFGSDGARLGADTTSKAVNDSSILSAPATSTETQCTIRELIDWCNQVYIDDATGK